MYTSCLMIRHDNSWGTPSKLYTVNPLPLCLTVRLLEEPQSSILNSDSGSSEKHCLEFDPLIKSKLGIQKHLKDTKVIKLHNVVLYHFLRREIGHLSLLYNGRHLKVFHIFFRYPCFRPMMFKGYKIEPIGLDGCWIQN